MANAMPQADGVQAASPSRKVISLSRDGGAGMLMGDLLSLTQLKLPVKVVVLNNGTLGFVELEQKSTGFLQQEPILSIQFRSDGGNDRDQRNPHRGPQGRRRERRQALAHPGPKGVDAVVALELAMPPAITVEMAKGFSLYMLKAILSGRGDEIVDLARTNLRRCSASRPRRAAQADDRP